MIENEFLKTYDLIRLINFTVTNPQYVIDALNFYMYNNENYIKCDKCKFKTFCATDAGAFIPCTEVPGEYFKIKNTGK